MPDNFDSSQSIYPYRLITVALSSFLVILLFPLPLARSEGEAGEAGEAEEERQRSEREREMILTILMTRDSRLLNEKGY